MSLLVRLLAAQVAIASSFVLTACSSSTSSNPMAASSDYPDANALANAAGDDNDWPLPGKNYSNNRYTGLNQITPQNVHSLTKAWSTEIADNGQQESSLVVWHGNMYFATPHDNVMAVDGATGKVKWQFPYNPSYSLLYNVTRGVGIGSGKIFLATMDCRILAVDATTGKPVWNVNGCPNDRYASTKNSLYSMAAYVFKNEVIVATAGGDLGNIGHVTSFSTEDGHKIWDWHNIPYPGEPGNNTWPGNTWQHGGGDAWGGLTIDPSTQTLFFSAGNPAPDLVDLHRKGLNLYTNSVVALDISGAKPKLRWYYQVTKNDTHDTDPAMPPTLFDAKISGRSRAVLAVGDKGGNLAVLDRTTGKQIYRTAVDKQVGLSTSPSFKGSFACPNHGGGIEWNGVSYDPATNELLVPSTQECAIWKIATTDPKYVPGQAYEGGPLPARQSSTGKLTAIDMGTGKNAWEKALPASAQGGVTLTQTGLAFTSDEAGELYAFDTKSGHLLWSANTGQSIIAPISVYSDGGNEYIAVFIGSAGAQQTPNVPIATSSYVVAYRLGPIANPIANGRAGQLVVTASGSNGPPSTGSAPYTAAQVAAGAKQYQESCSACHGAKLQGVSAPALTGGSFGNAHMTAASLQKVVTTEMPLTAPGSLKPDQDAAIMAYILKTDCVAQAGGGKQPFPSTASPQLANVKIGGRSCPVTP